jgi:DNA modification methylase
MHYQPSETFDFSSVEYDMIFTSPPYFMLERYENMPVYKSKQDFLDTFFLPVIRRAWEGLKTGGIMALNMPKEMYEALDMNATETLEMPIANRFGGKSRSENIYVWRKV